MKKVRCNDAQGVARKLGIWHECAPVCENCDAIKETCTAPGKLGMWAHAAGDNACSLFEIDTRIKNVVEPLIEDR